MHRGNTVWFCLVVFLAAGCARNIIWTKPDSHCMPLALSSASVTTNEFTLRAARYRVYLLHQTPCAVTTNQHPARIYEHYNKNIDCDISVTVRRDYGPVLFEKRVTNAELSMSSMFDAIYRLGYFETAERGRLVMVVSNTPSLHDDSRCHAQVWVEEILPK